MSAWLAAPGAFLLLAMVAAYAVWWLDRFAWEPLPRYVFTILLAATAGLALVAVPAPSWVRALQVGAATLELVDLAVLKAHHLAKEL